jgi:hypothetical protein
LAAALVASTGAGSSSVSGELPFVGFGIGNTKVVRVEILRKIWEGLHVRESGDRNTDRKILPNLEIHIYIYIYIYIYG